MRKILLGIDSLRIGGIQTALLNLLEHIDFTKYDVTLLLFHYEDEYRDLLPSAVKIKKASWLLDVLNHTMAEAQKRGVFITLLRVTGALFCRFVGSEKVYSVLLKSVHDHTEYDEAISFTNNGSDRSIYFGMNKCILERIQAKYKSTWLHVDFEQMGMNTDYNISEYQKFDRVIHVSKAAMESFLRYVPAMRDKSYVVYNLIGKHVKAAEETALDNEKLRIATVCRLDANKNVIDCVKVAAELKKVGISFEWSIIGDGGERDAIMDLIARYGMEKEIKMPGYIRNPYVQIANAHFLVSTSKTESYGMSIAEAIALHTPVVAYRYPAIDELVIPGKHGYVVEQGDVSGIAAQIANVWCNQEEYQKLRAACVPIWDQEAILAMFDRVFGQE